MLLPYFELPGKCSRNTLLIRDCHPGPVARKRSITSGSSRRLTKRFGASSVGRPRPRTRRVRSAASVADMGRIRASRASSSGFASGSASAASVIARSSSSVMAASCARALARAASRFISGVGITFHLRPRRLAETDHARFVMTAPDEYHDTQPGTAPADCDLPDLAVVLAGVDVVQRSVEIELDDIGKVQAMLGEVDGTLRIVPCDHRNNVATKYPSVNGFPQIRKNEGGLTPQGSNARLWCGFRAHHGRSCSPIRRTT